MTQLLNSKARRNAAKALEATAKATATATTEATEATVIATEALEAYEGALPISATATATTTEATEATLQGGGGGNTLQEALEATTTTEATPPPPLVTAESVFATQRGCFDRIIGRSARVIGLENRTINANGRDLQEAIDAFKPLLAKKDWWRQRSETIANFEQLYSLRMNGRSARAYEALACFHVTELASADSKATILTGRDGRPFPMATIEAIATWLDYDKASDEWSIRGGYESDLDTIIGRVAEDGLTAAQTTTAMDQVTSAKRLVIAEASGGAKAKATEAKAQATKSKADRTKALDKALDALAKTVASDKIGGASAAELLNKLADRGLAEATGLIEPATITTTEALAFAQRLIELDRAEIIYVLLTRFRAYEATATAKATTEATTATEATAKASKATAKASKATEATTEATTATEATTEATTATEATAKA